MQAMQVDGDLVRRINEQHLITTPLVPADLLFIFGTREGVDEFVDAALWLWRRDYFRWVLVTGGTTWNLPESEASVLCRKMVEAGIPRRKILTEDSARNTGENVEKSLPILEREIGLHSIKSLIAIGKLCTSKRYLMTLQKYWPGVEKMLLPINWFGVPTAEWHLHEKPRERVLSEWRKIEPYKEMGFIVDWPP